MNNTIEHFSKHLETVSQLASQYGRKADWDSLQNLLEHAGKDGLKLLVCGEFKRGKSSLVNALLKEDVCPVADGIATAVVSLIKYGKRRKVTRFYGKIVPTDEGKEELAVGSEEIAFEAISGFTQGTSVDLDNTLYLEIEIPSDALSNGLVLIDTPGIGSLDPRHLFLTRQMLPKADAMFFVTDTSNPMMTTELDFIRDFILPAEKPFAILLNKADMISGEERETAIQNIKKKLSDECGVNVSCIPVSATQWADSNRTGDERKKKRSNCDAVMAEVASFRDARRESLTELFRERFLNMLADIRSEMEKSVKELTSDTADSERDECLRQIDELKTLQKNILDEDSELRTK